MAGKELHMQLPLVGPFYLVSPYTLAGCNATPCIRNVFAVEVVNSEDPDAPVCYGEEVRLVLSGFVPDR